MCDSVIVWLMSYKKSTISSHNFNNKSSLMWCSCCKDRIKTLHNTMKSSDSTNCHISSTHVIINRTHHPHYSKILVSFLFVYVYVKKKNCYHWLKGCLVDVLFSWFWCVHTAVSLEILPSARSSWTNSGHSRLRISAPVKLPSPPIQMNRSMPTVRRLSAARFLPSLVRNSAQRDVPIKVPPYQRTTKLQYVDAIFTDCLCWNVLSLKIQTHRPNTNDEWKHLHCTFPYIHQKWHKALLLYKVEKTTMIENGNTSAWIFTSVLFCDPSGFVLILVVIEKVNQKIFWVI